MYKTFCPKFDTVLLFPFKKYDKFQSMCVRATDVMLEFNSPDCSVNACSWNDKVFFLC